MENVKQQIITACAFITKDGKLLAVKRADTKKFLPGIFELPGGHIEFGEKIEDGLKREIREELNAEIELMDPYSFYVFTYVTDNGTKHVVDINYFAIFKNLNQEITLNPSDHSEYRWITAEEVDFIFQDQGDFTNQERLTAKRGFEILKSRK